MNKDEILAKSRAENGGTDEMQLAIQRKAGSISGSVGLALCCIVALLEGILGDSLILFYGCFSIYWGIIATSNIVLAVALKNKYIWFAVINVVMFIVFMVKLIFELV